MPTLRRDSSHNNPIKDDLGDVVPSKLSVGSWVLYDVSNTLYFTAILGIFFPLWVVNDMGGTDSTVGFTVAAAMAVNLAIAPIVGTMSDRARRRLPFLAVLAITGIASTLLLGTFSRTATILLFVVSTVALHTGIVIYNALIVEVSTDHNRGLIAGMGVGIGYIGSLIAVAIGLTLEDNYVVAFRSVGVMMLVMTLPVLTLLRERPREVRLETRSQASVTKSTDILATLREATRYPGLINFLVARFWYYLAINTASIFAFLYGTKTIGFSERQAYIVLAIGIVVAIASAPLWGKLADRSSLHRFMKLIQAGWIVLLVGIVSIPWLDLPPNLYWLLGPVSGILVSGTWVADRPLLLKLVPSEDAGKFFGLHSLTGRLATIVGPALWGFMADDKVWFGLDFGLGLGQTASVATLIVATALALYFIFRSAQEYQKGTRFKGVSSSPADGDMNSR